MTGDPRWHNFLAGISAQALFFTGVEASRALSWDVVKKNSTNLGWWGMKVESVYQTVHPPPQRGVTTAEA